MAIRLGRAAAVAGLFLAAACGSDGSAGGGGSVSVQITGEELATSGLPFPEGGEVAIADGWALTFSHVLVTVGGITLSEDPDRSPTDQSQTGAVVARVRGPWVVDLAKDGSAPAEGGEGTAIPLVTIESMTERGGDPFVAEDRYAFGYETLLATDAAERVNLDGDAEALFETMIDRGYSVLYAGTATFAGESCETSDPDYDFDAIPTEVPFVLGFAAPAAFVNCQNQSIDANPHEGENYPRGIAIPSNRPATAQLTFHLEHAFYSALRHEPTLYFDQIAARLVGKEEGATVTLADLEGVDPTAFTDGAGAPLPNRVCNDTPLPGGVQRSFDVEGASIDPDGDPSESLRDYRDFITFAVSAQAHFNGGEGLCYVERKFPAPRL